MLKEARISYLLGKNRVRQSKISYGGNREGAQLGAQRDRKKEKHRKKRQEGRRFRDIRREHREDKVGEYNEVK